MRIDVLEFEPSEGYRVRGRAKIICDSLEMNLRICQYKTEKFYVEFPKIFAGNREPDVPFRMASKEAHFAFQKEVIDQIHAKWPMKLEYKVLENKI